MEISCPAQYTCTAMPQVDWTTGLVALGIIAICFVVVAVVLFLDELRKRGDK